MTGSQFLHVGKFKTKIERQPTYNSREKPTKVQNFFGAKKYLIICIPRETKPHPFKFQK